MNLSILSTSAGDACALLRKWVLASQEAGLLKPKPEICHDATIADVVENPRESNFVQPDGPQISRLLDDMEATVGSAAFAKLGGLDPNRPLVLENPNDLYAPRFITRPGRADHPRIKQFIQSYQATPEVNEISEEYYGDVI